MSIRTSLFAVVSVLVLAISACARSGAEPAGTPVAKQAAAATSGPIETGRLIEQCWQSYASEDAVRYRQCYAADAKSTVVDFIPAVQATGIDEIMARIIEPFWKGFSGTEERQLTLVNGAKGVSFARFRGKSDGPYLGRPATGAALDIMSAQLVTTRDGKFADEERYVDEATLVAQLGLLDADVGYRKSLNHELRRTEVVVAAGDAKEAANIEVVRKQNAAFNRHDTEGVFATYAADGKDIFLPGHDSIGPDIRKASSGYFAVTSDVRNDLQSIWAAGDFVVAVIDAHGTWDRPIPGKTLPEVKKTFKIRELAIFLVQDGKIKEQWTFGSFWKLLYDLGWAPEPAKALKSAAAAASSPKAP
jgi:ketosteroid isomerase-like protein/predicted ester cyclase